MHTRARGCYFFLVFFWVGGWLAEVADTFFLVFLWLGGWGGEAAVISFLVFLWVGGWVAGWVRCLRSGGIKTCEQQAKRCHFSTACPTRPCQNTTVILLTRPLYVLFCRHLSWRALLVLENL